MERADRRLVKNQPYDESVEVSDSAEDASIYGRSQAEHGRNRRVRGLMSASSSSDECDEEREPQRVKGPISRQGGVSPNEEDDESEEDSESDSDDDDVTAEAPEGAYDPADYANLPVSTEIKELFQYIIRYTPQSVELEHSLRPFIPDFIPAVGDIDAFLKVPRPDTKPDGLGMLVLDEPSVKQSDPTVLSLWLSEETKQHGNTKVKVTSVASPHSNPRAVDSWVDSIGALHRSKAAASVQYARAMPDIDTLMQEWPPDVEETLGGVHLPHAGLHCSLRQYCDIVCALLDIPVYCSRIQALHLLFSLFLEFRDSQHFART
ncbi:intraflagellar transport protein 46 homolog [Dunckerocampus dactyliophorus]|uniref:intraflagellar transport protein 46 homolog n=1 Tax=Dunckerocampus dactyliophorus TaxID=161453 RepID=UPI00240687E8|nr:intraflagellar transport protein 46 homolog [Dunckerocampus dactyliophorus]XP_054608699.1 intraflagellar transport protein 46 homolog [Dunckerocampus dactyliophorus]